MVNSNIIRGLGLIVMAGVYVVYERTFDSQVIQIAKSLGATLIGAGRGSMYNTCDPDSKALQKLTSVNLAEKPATDLSYNFYSINNPKEYLSGNDAIVFEKGPYKLRKHSVKYDVAQTTSTLTKAASPEPKGALEYNVAKAYLTLDRDLKATSNLERSADLSLSFSGNKVKLPETKKALASHLSMTDSVVNLSPDYLSLLGTLNDEVNMILSLICTSDQIQNIGVAGKSQCSGNELGDILAPNCACCMMDDDFVMATSRNSGTPPAFTNCNSYFDDEGAAISKLSLFASYDGGVAVKAAGEKKYDGSGDDFASTMYGQTEIHTALIQSHSVNDLMFGYPSAFLGLIAPHAQMEYAKKSPNAPGSKTELAKLMLTGQMDNELPFKLGNMAEYTSKVGSVCYASCTGGQCSGNAPGRHETTDIEKIKLGGINCKPYTSTLNTVAKCLEINAFLQSNPGAGGYELCTCANGSNEWSTQGCCLAGGMKPDSGDLTGEGCLYEVAGLVDPNYVGLDTSIAGAMDLGTALKTWIDRESSKKSTEFMCPANGAALDEHAKFGQYESYDGSAEHVTFYHTGNDRIRQDDVTSVQSTAYKSGVSGSSGKYFPPKGLHEKAGTSQISDGYPKKVPHPVYVSTAKKTIDFQFEGVREKNLRNKICGSDTCIISARFRPTNTTFHVNANETDGAGLPFNGLQPVGHMSGPSISGRPEYLHQPLYFDGDEALYTQQDCAYAQRANGNGIKMYRPKTDSDPGAFSEATYQLVDKSYVSSMVDTLHSHIDVEVASGLGARQRMRFGKSYSIWECDPSTNAKCKLAVTSKGQSRCYGTTGSSVFSSKETADKNDLTTLGRNTFTYPCSAANLLTPHVVGGKIIPMYWYEESTMHATTDEIDVLAAFAASYSEAGNTYITVATLCFTGFYIGMAMLFLCMCFEPKHSFMQAQSASDPTATTAESTKSTAA